MKGKLGHSIILLSVMAAVGFLYISTSGATEPSIFILGTVEAISGDTVTIRLKGSLFPRPGDKVEIGFISPDGIAVSVGMWKVNRINKDWTVEADAVKTAGEPNVGMNAVIIPENPRIKDEILKEFIEETGK